MTELPHVLGQRRRRRRHHRDVRARREPEQDRERDQARLGLAHGDEEEDEETRYEALRRQDRERTVRVGEPVRDDSAKDGSAVENRKGVLRDVVRNAVQRSIILDVKVAVSVLASSVRLPLVHEMQSDSRLVEPPHDDALGGDKERKALLTERAKVEDVANLPGRQARVDGKGSGSDQSDCEEADYIAQSQHCARPEAGRWRLAARREARPRLTCADSPLEPDAHEHAVLHDRVDDPTDRAPRREEPKRRRPPPSEPMRDG